VGAKWLGQKAHPHRRRFTKPNQTEVTVSVADNGAGPGDIGATGGPGAAVGLQKAPLISISVSSNIR